MTCTLIIPTYNRPRFLSAQLNCLTRSKHAFPIIVLDSSTETFAQENLQIAKLYEAVSYSHLPSDTKVFVKFAQGFAMAATPYAVLVPDDDFLAVDHLPALIKALDQNPEAVSAHGYYFEFHETLGSFHLSSLIESSPTIKAASPNARVHALMTRYEAITYAVHRTNVARETFALASRQTAILAQELLQGTASAAKGAILRVPILSHGRRAESSIGYEDWHPMTWMAVDPSALFVAYKAYREALLAAVLTETGEADPERAGRAIDLAHLCYLSEFLEPQVLSAVAPLDPREYGAEAVRAAALESFAQLYGPSWARALRGHGRISHWVRRTAGALGLRQKIAALTNLSRGFRQQKMEGANKLKSGASGPAVLASARFRADCAKHCPSMDVERELELIADALPALSMAGISQDAADFECGSGSRGPARKPAAAQGKSRPDNTAPTGHA